MVTFHIPTPKQLALANLKTTDLVCPLAVLTSGDDVNYDSKESDQ